MKIFKVLAVAICASLLAGCAQPAPQEIAGAKGDRSAQEIVLVDMMGNQVALDGEPQRIVALQASDVEVLYAIGAQDRLVGVGEYCDYPAEAKQKAIVSSGDNTNIEQILELAPDLLIVGSMAQSKEQIDMLKQADIDVIMTDAKDIAGAFTSIEMLGKATGCEQGAKDVIDDMKHGFDAINKKAGDGSKSIYFEVSPLEYGLWTTGSGTFMQELAQIIGVKNIFDDVEGWAEVSEEQVIERNPDYIATVTMYFGEGATPTEEIEGRKNWQDISALQNGKVFQADNDAMTRPGPRLVQGAQALYDFVYGG